MCFGHLVTEGDARAPCELATFKALRGGEAGVGGVGSLESGMVRVGLERGEERGGVVEEHEDKECKCYPEPETADLILDVSSR